MQAEDDHLHQIKIYPTENVTDDHLDETDGEHEERGRGAGVLGLRHTAVQTSVVETSGIPGMCICTAPGTRPSPASAAGTLDAASIIEQSLAGFQLVYKLFEQQKHIANNQLSRIHFTSIHLEVKREL